MRKLFSIVLALVMMLCVFAQADEVPQPEGGKKFDTNWAIFGITVRIDYEEEGYRVYIRSSDPDETEGTEWEYSCAYNEERDVLISISSSKNPWTKDPETGDLVRGEYEYQEFDMEDQETVFAIDEEGYLTWADGRGEAGADLVFSDIGKFEGYWKSEDGKTSAAILWSDSELDDAYGYSVLLHDEGDESYADYVLHGLYDAQTGKLTTTGAVLIHRLNEAGEYTEELVEEDPEEPWEIIFSELGGGKILLERDNGIELIYDFLGGDAQG